MRIALLSILFSCSVPALPASAPAAPAAWEPCAAGAAVEHPSVVRVRAEGRLCTGVAIAPDLVATSAHCVEGATGAVWIEHFGRRHEAVAVTVRGPRGLDLAAIRVAPGRLPAAPVGAYRPGVGDVVHLIGYGCARDHGVQLLRRAVVIPGISGDPEIPMAGCACKGDSGAPVIDLQGRVRGINWAASDTRVLAIDAAELRALVDF